MSYSYLKHLNSNIIFIAGFTLVWTLIFFYFGGVSHVFLAYTLFSALFFLLTYLHTRGKDLLSALGMIIVSELTLILASPGINTSPMTGIGYLYIIIILYAYAFFIEDMKRLCYITIFSACVIFSVINCTSLFPKMLLEIQSLIPDQTRIMIFGFTSIAFVVRLFIFSYEAANEYTESRQAHIESDTFFANLEESICILDRSLSMRRFNRAFIEIFRKQHGTKPIEGTNFASLKMDQKRRKMYEANFARAFSGEQLSIEFDFILEQVAYVFEVSFCPIRNKKGNIDRIGVIYRDITARKKLEMDIVYTQNGLLEMIAHDLKAPLAMIKSINSLADDRENQYNKFIDKTCVQTIASIDNVLAFSRYLVTSDTSGYVVEDIGKVLADRVAEIDPNASLNGQQLFLKVVDPDLQVRINRDAFGRAMGNLISNSIKFTEGAGEIHIRVMRDGDNFAVIRVSDQGIGIPEEIRDHLFDRFSKAGRNGLHGEQSYGLGLYISNVIIKLHGGTIALDTEKSVETTFIIRLPLADVELPGL
jgi:signal transduction histidine kinase